MSFNFFHGLTIFRLVRIFPNFSIYFHPLAFDWHDQRDRRNATEIIWCQTWPQFGALQYASAWPDFDDRNTTKLVFKMRRRFLSTFNSLIFEKFQDVVVVEAEWDWCMLWCLKFSSGFSSNNFRCVSPPSNKWQGVEIQILCGCSQDRWKKQRIRSFQVISNFVLFFPGKSAYMTIKYLEIDHIQVVDCVIGLDGSVEQRFCPGSPIMSNLSKKTSEKE